MAKESPELAKKLTAKAILGPIREHIRQHSTSETKSGDMLPGYTIIGQVIGHTTGESDFGPWIKLKGRFRATRDHDGKVYVSSAAMLPEECTDAVMAALTLDEVKSVDMAFKIGIKIDDTAATGYTYTAEPLIKPAEDDPLERLANQVAGQALPAPDAKTDAKAGSGAKSK